MTNLKPNKYYYIKHKYPERTIDRKLEKGWAGYCSYDVAEVLCDVPTYEEYCIERKLIMDLSEENEKLKELLKECKEVIKNVDTYYGNYDSTNGYLVINKINEALR